METNLKFNSAICTSRQQSERLLALGLKRETADMCINLSHESELVYSFSYSEALSLYHNYGLDRITNTDSLLPAWSLHRLLCLYGQDYEIKELYNNAEECYGMLITAIEIAIENGDFNQEYLDR